MQHDRSVWCRISEPEALSRCGAGSRHFIGEPDEIPFYKRVPPGRLRPRRRSYGGRILCHRGRVAIPLADRQGKNDGTAGRRGQIWKRASRDVIPFFFDVLAYGAIFVLVVLGLGVIASMMGIFNFAHGEFVLLGAYTVYLLEQHGLPVWAGMIAAPFAVGVVGLLLERIVIRRFYATPIVAMLGTYAIGLALRETVRCCWAASSTPSPRRWSARSSFGEVSISKWRTAVIVITALVMVGCCLLLDPHAASVCRCAPRWRIRRWHAPPASPPAGCMPRPSRSGAALAGLAGGLMVPIYALSADMGVPFLIKSFLAVMLGGMGSFEGAMAGAAFVGGSSAALPWAIKPVVADVVGLHDRDRDREGSAGRPVVSKWRN